MQAAAYMMSLLTRQHRLLGPAFFTAHQADWLVWEPGPSAPARTLAQSNLQQTLNPRVAQPALPLHGDALCFELKRGPGAVVRVGRALENDVVLNDLTVSREHFSLAWAAGGWLLALLNGTVQVEGRKVEAPVGLRGGESIAVGDLRLTFFTVERFLERLRSEVERLAPG